jgi:hypothetical protein
VVRKPKQFLEARPEGRRQEEDRERAMKMEQKRLGEGREKA